MIANNTHVVVVMSPSYSACMTNSALLLAYSTMHCSTEITMYEQLFNLISTKISTQITNINITINC